MVRVEVLHAPPLALAGDEMRDHVRHHGFWDGRRAERRIRPIRADAILLDQFMGLYEYRTSFGYAVMPPQRSQHRCCLRVAEASGCRTHQRYKVTLAGFEVRARHRPGLASV